MSFLHWYRHRAKITKSAIFDGFFHSQTFLLEKYQLDFQYRGLTRQFYSFRMWFKKYLWLCTLLRGPYKLIMPRRAGSNDVFSRIPLKIRFEKFFCYFKHLQKLILYQ